MSGRDAWRAQNLPGSTHNSEQGRYEVSLTLETLRALRKTLKLEPQAFASLLHPEVLRWAKAAGKSEAMVNALHAKLDTGWRQEFPWEGGVPPFAHQEVMATAAAHLDGVAFLGEMGTGKTRAAVEAIAHMLRTDSLDVVVVVCPRGVMGTWQRQFAKWSPGTEPQMLLGPVRDRIAAVEAIRLQAVRGRHVLVMNYDVLRQLQPVLEMLAESCRVGLVLDEMHRVNNPTAQRTKAALSLAQKALWKVGMTGTPILNGPENIWSQWYVIDLGVTFGPNWVQFRREFFTLDYTGFKLMPTEPALLEIGTRMQRRGLRYRKVDCLDLPPKLYETLAIEMTPKQRAAYREMAEDLLARLEQPVGADATTSAANQLVMILRLTQITSGFVKTDAGEMFRFQPNPKLEALKELVHEQIRERKIIVWAWYKEDVRAICEAFEALHPLRIVGGQTQTERDDAERLFTDDQHLRLMVANPGAGGVGLNLQAASMAVYYSQGYSLGDRLQSEDRCHRAGSEIHQKVTYVDLCCERSIDEVIQNALQGKLSVANAVVDLRRHLEEI